MDDDNNIERITLAALGLASAEETERVREILSGHPELAMHRVAAEWKAHDWKPRYSRSKRLFDIALATILLVIMLPIFIIASLLLLCGQRSFPIFKRAILGKGGVRLNIYHFRCMYNYVDAPKKYLKKVERLKEQDGPAFKLNYDPRYTLTGRWVRKCGLMQLPSLYNVIRGELSLVGPSPQHYITSTYVIDEQPDYFKRFAVFPGLFSLRDVLMERTDQARWLPAIVTPVDLYYVRNASMSLDIRILAASMLALIRVPRNIVATVCGLPSLESITQSETAVEPEMIAAYGRFADIYRLLLDPAKWMSLTATN
jgi:lipopolysaccharide/colanic/teichoic acid biosynthesis glycosyltransferase